MIDFALPSKRIIIEMLAHRIDAADILLFRNQAKLTGRNAVARTTERLRQNLLSSCLRSNGCHVLCRNHRIGKPCQIVNGGNVFIQITRRTVRSAPHLRKKGILLNAVPG